MRIVMHTRLKRSITDKNIMNYQNHGVVCIKHQFSKKEIENTLAICINNDFHPGGNRNEIRDQQGSGRFVAVTNATHENIELKNFALFSPAGEIAGRLMALDQVYFFYDQLFVKTPRTTAPTAWHNDLPFWPFNGEQIASVWIALTDVPRENSGLIYISGSHKWNKMFYPEPATPRQDFVFGEAKDYEQCPSFHKEFDNPEYKFLSWDLKAGDCIIHHPLVVHGSGKNISNNKTRVGLSLRYFGGDATWTNKRTQFHVPGTEDDIFKFGEMPINPKIFPLAWSTS